MNRNQKYFCLITTAIILQNCASYHAVHQQLREIRLSKMKVCKQVSPRVLRLRDAPGYLGMDKNRFNSLVRPAVTQVKIGTQGIGFDRLELDAWFEEYKSRNGRPAQKGEITWDANEYPDSSSGLGFGISTKPSSGGEFAKALAQINSKKRKGT